MNGENIWILFGLDNKRWNKNTCVIHTLHGDLQYQSGKRTHWSYFPKALQWSKCNYDYADTNQESWDFRWHQIIRWSGYDNPWSIGHEILVHLENNLSGRPLTKCFRWRLWVAASNGSIDQWHVTVDPDRHRYEQNRNYTHSTSLNPSPKRQNWFWSLWRSGWSKHIQRCDGMGKGKKERSEIH